MTPPGMARLRTVTVLLVAAVAILAVAVAVAAVAERYPEFAGPVVLAGILIPGLSFGVLGARMLVGKRRLEFAAKLRASERTICFACLMTGVGVLLSTFGSGAFAVIGVVLSACGLCMVLWLVLRAVPDQLST